MSSIRPKKGLVEKVDVVWSDEMVYLRGFAILAVIFVHVADSVHKSMAWMSKSQTIVFFLEGIAKGYPEFVLVSGFALTRVWARGDKSLKTFYWRRIRSAVPPYLVFSVIYFIYAGKYHGQLPHKLLADFALSLWYANTSSQLWFIINLAQLYLMFPLLYALLHSANRKGTTGYFLTVIFILHMLWMGFATVVFKNQIHADLMARRFILSSIFFFCLGIATGLNYEAAKEKLRKIPASLILALLGLVGYFITVIRLEGVRRSGHYYSMLIPYTTYFFLLRSVAHTLNILILSQASHYLTQTQSWFRATMGSLGQYSFGIFLVHEIVRLESEKAFAYISIDHSDAFFYPVMIVSVTLISWAVAWVVSKFPFSQYLIGRTEGRGISGVGTSLARV